jgi:hypothetical protein
MTISIWYKHGDHKPEIIDRANNEREAAYLEHEYKMAYGCLPGQRRYKKDKVWAGRRDQEPPLPTDY